MNTVPVISFDNKSLMPTTFCRAKKWIKKGRATPFYKLGIFCIRMNEKVGDKTQSIVVGIDPGGTNEGWSVVSEKHTILNIQSGACYSVKENLEVKRNMRKGRRFRNTPCRQPRWSNRGNSSRIDRVPPSTKARWDIKLLIAKTLKKMFPISGFVVEDIKAKTIKGKDRRNTSFSPLEVGKKYFYRELGNIAPVATKSGYKTSRYRNMLGLDKDHDSPILFNRHCVDAYALAKMAVGGQSLPDNIRVDGLVPSILKRRQLHTLQYAKNRGKKSGKQNIRRRVGGTRSLGFTRGSIVKYIGKANKTLSKANPKLIFRVGGYDEEKNKLTLCSLTGEGKDGGRISRYINPIDVKHKSYNRFLYKVKEK